MSSSIDKINGPNPQRPRQPVGVCDSPGDPAAPVTVDPIGPEAATVLDATTVEQVFPAQLAIQSVQGELDSYRRGLARLNHDVRAFLNSMLVKVRTVKCLSSEFGDDSVVKDFEKLYERLLIGEKDGDKPELSIMDKWCEVAQQSCVDPKAVISQCRTYATSVVRPEYRKLTDSLILVAERMQEVPGGLVNAQNILRTMPDVMSLVNNFIEHGGSNIVGTPEVFQPVDLINETVNTISDNWTGMQMNITVEQQGGTAPVSMDRAFFKNCMANLISNSAKACQRLGLSGDQAQCLITTSQVGDKVRIEIRDNGPGIPQGIIGKIFDEGFSTTHGEEKGSAGAGTNQGLGLSSVKQCIEAAGGTISVHSSQGEDHYACFVIDLPSQGEKRDILFDEPQAKDKAPDVTEVQTVEKKRPSQTGPFEILLLDDSRDTNESMRFLMELLLPKGKYSIKTATSIQAAVQIIGASPTPPHLILADVNIGGDRDGPEIKHDLDRLNCTGTRIIAVSGEPEYIVQERFPYIDGTLQKPVDPDVLIKQVVPKIRREFFPSDT